MDFNAIPHRRVFCIIAALAAGAVATTVLAGDDDTPKAKVSFARDVRPIFNQNCIACHGGIKRAAGFSFVYRDTVVGKTADDDKVVVPGDPDASELIARVSASDPEERMPPAEHGSPLSPEQIDILRRWIAEGAPWENHWAFESLNPRPLPQVSRTDWCRNDLDYYVLKHLDDLNQAPNVAADPGTWIRRVSLDLIGIPPSETELREFLKDPSSEAQAKVVDRLLASPRFGERWATPWLDLARYADTMGFEKDPPREIWPYRDWVIQALNDDMPFDQFTIKQIAGDLLPEATIGDRLATAFHRNTQANTEGGTDDEEFRVAAVIDRANTTAQVWLGLTMGCAQCHDHPYEPITNAEYYQFLAYFNNTRDFDTNEEFPRASIPYNREKWLDASQIDREITEQNARFRAISDDWFTRDRWQNAIIKSAEATGETDLVVGNVDGWSEIRTTDRLSSGSNYTVDCSVPEKTTRLTAVMLEALPQDEVAAAKVPQTGFILSQFKLLIVPSVGEPKLVPLKFAFDEDPDPFYSASESLDPNLQGWSSYPRQSQPNRAIFVLAQAVELPPGSTLRFVLEHQSGSEHIFQLRRARFWFTDDEYWSDESRLATMEEYSCELAQLNHARRQVNSISVPIMAEMPPGQRRTTRIFHRGSFLDPTESVEPATPRVLENNSSSAPTNRLELARWLVSPQNPLTARVYVNRVWNELFGAGIVESIENFGSSGRFPSNENLLDVLAYRFQSEWKWQLKPLLREIVLSNAYGQSSRAMPQQFEEDPRNRNLARGPRNRLSAEMIRDQALAVSGLLTKKMFGPPVMPPQPDGLWLSAYSGESWRNATGEDRYRRALYTYCKRTSGYPALLTFDAPTRDVCVVQRIATNTPLQALVTLNDPAYVEIADEFGKRIEQCEEKTPSEKIAWGFWRVTCHVPTRDQVEHLTKLYDQAIQFQQADSTGAARSPYAVVASTILNLDEALTK